MKPQFTDDCGSFLLEQPQHNSYLYFPLASECGLKSAVTPSLNGDAKIDQETFLLEPVSSENLHNNRSSRNFWLALADGSTVSATGESAMQEALRFTKEDDDCHLHAGFMWHELTRTLKEQHLTSTITSFVPSDSNVEIMKVTIKNDHTAPITFTPYAAMPLYGRSADNIRDHRNVTSMLHRIFTKEYGIEVKPTMSFDERGHRVNEKIYYVYGFDALGKAPQQFFPTVEDFLGEGGTYTHPRAIYERLAGCPSGSFAEGKEAMGAFSFESVTLEAGQEASYIVLLGVESSNEAIDKVFASFATMDAIDASLAATKQLWKEKVNVTFKTGSPEMDNFMKWVCFQPFLRRLFGCSFLPHHDYGRGGRGWRDLWQDCLSLLLMEPDQVGQMIHKNFGGVRIDGTNATIIGDGDGNFIADRNGIARVWMDHALWPQMTTKLYIDQTGDVAILNKKASYFKDAQAIRGTAIDALWNAEQGNLQKDAAQNVYEGSILEHLLLQQLAAFYEVGDHNIYRLRGADWNDALDMAAERGESVAFTCAYAGNLRELAQMIRLLKAKTQLHSIDVLAEMQLLLNNDRATFDSIEKKQEILTQYAASVKHQTSGKTISLSLEELAQNLEEKASYLTEHLRADEWVDGGENEGWFNSYYDNHGRKVEGFFESGVRMMLTGQVFSIMGQVASDEQIRRIVNSADHYLYRAEIGGYRLNTNFHEQKFDMGRMFGFAYGEKENGAVFSHMTVMFANALYRRGFAKEGWKALKTLADHALNFEVSRIYPGVPEYFRADGRGMYHYLTGAASWFMMTMMTEVFGVKGDAGDLCFRPQLMAEQFDENGKASLALTFANKKLQIVYENEQKKDAGDYRIASVSCANMEMVCDGNEKATLPRNIIEALTDDVTVITVKLV